MVMGDTPGDDVNPPGQTVMTEGTCAVELVDEVGRVKVRTSSEPDRDGAGTLVETVTTVGPCP